MKMTSNIYQADTPTINGIIYPKEELIKAVENFNNKVQHVVFSDTYPPSDEENNISVGTVTLTMENDFVIANITAEKEWAQKVQNRNLKCLPTCYGTVSENDDHTVVVNDITIDTVCCVLSETVNTGSDEQMFTCVYCEEDE